MLFLGAMLLGQTFVWPFMTANPSNGVTMSWRSAEPTAGSTSLGGSTLPEFDSTNGPIWKMHLATPPTGTSDVPLTNAITNAGVRIQWPGAVYANRMRLHNIGSSWGSTQTPKTAKLWGKRADNAEWALLHTYSSAIGPGADTGWITISTPRFCTEFVVWLTGDGGNTAQSLCFADFEFT